MNGGRQTGAKLARSARVARQLKRVATKIGLPEASVFTSWTSMSPVVWAVDRHVDRVIAVLGVARVEEVLEPPELV